MIYKKLFQKSYQVVVLKKIELQVPSSKVTKFEVFIFLKLLYKSLSSSCSNSVSSIFKELLISISFTIFATLLNVALESLKLSLSTNGFKASTF